MFGCLFRFLRLILTVVVLAAVAGAVYYYARLHPEKAPWRDGASALKDRMETVTLSAQVRAALSLRESLKNLDVSVAAERDVVTLRGRVPSAEVSKTVESVAASVSGVRQVVNFLEIDKAAGRPNEEADNRSIGEKVRAAFKLDKELASASFEVKSIRRVLRITSSTATTAQRRRALEVARSVEGVASAEM
jgi:osmotically-inducible protein OsmY